MHMTTTEEANALRLIAQHGQDEARNGQDQQRRADARDDEMRDDEMLGDEALGDEALAGQAAQKHAAPGTAAPVSIDIVALYTEHRTHLLRFVQRYVGSHEDAEDVVQNTFIEAVKCAHRFSGLSKPSTWLFGIALNLARNQVRRRTADRYDMVDEEFMERLIDTHADPAMLIELRQIAQKVDDLLGELPPRIRSTFEAVLDGDATYEEAAQQLEIPIGTVRSRVSRVRAAVRLEYGQGPR